MRRYVMTPWVITLNETSPDLEQLLPPTDTRLRADIRALEQGIYDKARKGPPLTCVHSCEISLPGG